jgi:hypothetical protein
MDETDVITDTAVETEAPAPTVDAGLAGVPHGTELITDNGIEIVVEEKDADGTVIGWHKEVKGSK